jgi:hypothetical protein
VNVSLLELPVPVSIPTDTGTWFAAGLTDRGPTAPTLVQSLNDFVTRYGDRVTYSILYDAIDTYFREGGNRVFISRVVGPGATSGGVDMVDSGGSVVSLIATATGPGAWSANYKVAVVAGSVGYPTAYRIQVTDGAGTVLEDSGDLVNQGEAIQWSQYSQYIRITPGPSALIPYTMGATAMSAGNDDRNNIDDSSWAAAHARFDKDLGPGQISSPGRVSNAAYNQLAASAQDHNRTAIIDFPNSGTLATLEASAASIRSRWCAGFAPWVIVPGLVTGTVRVVPPSALIAGLIARNDPAVGTNHPSAGNAGLSLYCIDLSQPSWTDLDRQTLNGASVNVIRRMFGGIRVYGWRALVDSIGDYNWVDFANARFYTQLVAELDEVGESYVFAEIDGPNGATINGFHDALAAVMLTHYNQGELYGSTAAEAFSVDTSSRVNTLQTIAALELHAIVTVKMAPFAEYVVIQVVKRPVTVAPPITVSAV